MLSNDPPSGFKRLNVIRDGTRTPTKKEVGNLLPCAVTPTKSPSDLAGLPKVEPITDTTVLRHRPKKQPNSSRSFIPDYESSKAKLLSILSDANSQPPEPCDYLWRPSVAVKLLPTRCNVYISFECPHDVDENKINASLHHRWVGSKAPNILHLYGSFHFSEFLLSSKLPGNKPDLLSAGPEPFSFLLDLSSASIAPSNPMEIKSTNTQVMLSYLRKPPPTRPTAVLLRAFNGSSNLGSCPRGDRVQNRSVVLSRSGSADATTT